ncbi:hypothetical protein LCGC14_2909130, partial [marine sediment metagenome]
EHGSWKDRRFTLRDMQFEQLRRFNRETFRQAYGFPKPLLGDVEDVNRANAEAAEIVFARWLQVPRLNRWRTLLNDDFLPAFGSMGSGFVFDYENPIPQLAADAELEEGGPLVRPGDDEPAEVRNQIGVILRELHARREVRRHRLCCSGVVHSLQLEIAQAPHRTRRPELASHLG